MSRELWAELVGEARRGCCDQYRKPCGYHEGYGDGAEAALVGGGADFDAIWGRYTRLGKRTWLTKSELRKVVGLEPEEDE